MSQPSHQIRARALYEMLLSIVKAKGETVHESANAWTKLTAEQRAFWEAMAEHDRRAKSLARSEGAAD